MRLLRPHVPLLVRCQVARRQLKETGSPFKAFAGTLTLQLEQLRGALAKTFRCQESDLRLDHDPPLGAREKVHDWVTGEHTGYIPDANSPDHLNYRPHGPQFAGSHLIKTNVRGEHGQHPDRVLIKKERRRERGPKPKRGPKMQGRGFTSSTDKLKPKPKWPSRPFPKKRKER